MTRVVQARPHRFQHQPQLGVERVGLVRSDAEQARVEHVDAVQEAAGLGGHGGQFRPGRRNGRDPAGAGGQSRPQRVKVDGTRIAAGHADHGDAVLDPPPWRPHRARDGERRPLPRCRDLLVRHPPTEQGAWSRRRASPPRRGHAAAARWHTGSTPAAWPSAARPGCRPAAASGTTTSPRARR